MTTFADLVPSPAGRFDGIERPYTPQDVLRLRGSVPITHTLAERGANVVNAWELFASNPQFQGALPWAGILDGEILAWDTAAHRPLPFAELQKRIGRKTVPKKLKRKFHHTNKRSEQCVLPFERWSQSQ